MFPSESSWTCSQTSTGCPAACGCCCLRWCYGGLLPVPGHSAGETSVGPWSSPRSWGLLGSRPRERQGRNDQGHSCFQSKERNLRVVARMVRCIYRIRKAENRENQESEKTEKIEKQRTPREIRRGRNCPKMRQTAMLVSPSSPFSCSRGSSRFRCFRWLCRFSGFRGFCGFCGFAVCAVRGFCSFRSFHVLAACAVLAVFALPPLMSPRLFLPGQRHLREVPASSSLQ